jgi:hypothetical protein
MGQEAELLAGERISTEKIKLGCQGFWAELKN